MNDIELLDLISKGDTEQLLNQKDLTRRLNSLAQIGVIDICEGKITITKKGDIFQKDRKFILLQNVSMPNEFEEFSAKSLKRNSLYVYLSLIFLCTAAVLCFILITKGF